MTPSVLAALRSRLREMRLVMGLMEPEEDLTRDAINSVTLAYDGLLSWERDVQIVSSPELWEFLAEPIDGLRSTEFNRFDVSLIVAVGRCFKSASSIFLAAT